MTVPLHSPSLDTTSDPQPANGIFRLSWQALMLQEDVYEPFLAVEKPFRRGLIFLTLMLLPVALATSLGLLFDHLTMPQLREIQSQVYAVATQIGFVQEYFSQKPYLESFFSLLYNLLWFILRSYGNYPSQVHIIASLFLVVVSGLFDWITYAMIAQWVARWVGAEFRRGVFYAPMALAYAPRLLLIANIFPGLTVPAGLVRFWIFATSYQAIRATFKLSWKRSLVVVFLPYLITTLLLILSLFLGIILGIGVYQIMYA